MNKRIVGIEEAVVTRDAMRDAILGDELGLRYCVICQVRLSKNTGHLASGLATQQ